MTRVFRFVVSIAILTAALILALPAGAFAASEDGDAGDLPGTAQDLTSAPVDTLITR